MESFGRKALPIEREFQVESVKKVTSRAEMRSFDCTCRNERKFEEVLPNFTISTELLISMSREAGRVETRGSAKIWN